MSVRKKEELTIEQAAAHFCVEIASVTRWVENPNPKQTRNKPAMKIDMVATGSSTRYKRKRSRPRAATYELRYKQTLQHPKADEDKRHTFQEAIKANEAQNRVIVYIDESGFAHDMPRTHGYASIGKRFQGVCN
ncbi:hypothetical protein [Nitrosomonas communis]|uniref:DDE superfamily endonuclease n=1 Tax=Nitrosomonas communis TaxID=44574 RepID=A0A1I4LVW8_9PROT|nr:hypothetical protein [Nitrosomonas communis]SFL94926.1 hypothetical protein SAMN05421863_1007112 [Nitrosomonas communis]